MSENRRWAVGLSEAAVVVAAARLEPLRLGV